MVSFSLGSLVVHGYNVIVELLKKDFVVSDRDDNILETAKVKEIELSNGQSGTAIDNNPFLAFGIVRKVGDKVSSVEVGDYIYVSFSLMTPENMFFLNPIDMLTTGVTNYLCIGEHNIKLSYSDKGGYVSDGVSERFSEGVIK